LNRKKLIFPLAIGQHHSIKRQMLNWINQFSIFLFLDNNDYSIKPASYECLAGVNPGGTFESLHDLGSLSSWHGEHKDWLFGHISYDYKNKLEKKLSSSHSPELHFPEISFFNPEIVCYIGTAKKDLIIETVETDPEAVLNEILRQSAEIESEENPVVAFQPGISKEEYLGIINKLKQHIIDGDCYEINYCCLNSNSNATINPLSAYKKLNKISPAPFSAYYRLEDKYMMSASPERYLRKEDDRIISQPIKGTARRGQNTEEDERNKKFLFESEKERAENVMIVDLVRNDLARSCETSSVKVDELFGIYSFPQVHQMISTVSGTLKHGLSFTDAIRYSFPMGSMTGAPKIKVMELIDQYENSAANYFLVPLAIFLLQGILISMLLSGVFFMISHRITFLMQQAGLLHTTAIRSRNMMK
jgi:para-aminobenzoate synthetase component I